MHQTEESFIGHLIYSVLVQVHNTGFIVAKTVHCSTSKIEVSEVVGWPVDIVEKSCSIISNDNAS